MTTWRTASNRIQLPNSILVIYGTRRPFMFLTICFIIRWLLVFATSPIQGQKNIKPRSLREWIGSTQNWMISVWFQASAATQMRSPLSLDVTHCRRFGTTDRSRETSATNYQSTLRNIPEEQRQFGDQLNSTRFLITPFKFCSPTACIHAGLSERETKFYNNKKGAKS